MNIEKFLIKIIALFSVIRGYNLIILALAQYLASLFIFSQERTHFFILENIQIHEIILSSILSVAGGYIINNFYDLERDKLKQPLYVYLNKQVSQSFKLSTYIVLNFLGLVIASLVSWKVFIFFLIYQFLVWFYSHKINKLALIRNLYLVIIQIIPFFCLMIYFDNYSEIIFFHAGYLIILLLVTDLVKNLSSQKIDLIHGYISFPIKYGTKNTKKIITVLIISNCYIGFYLTHHFSIGMMKYFFWFACFFLLMSILILWNIRTRTQYKLLHFFFKIIIVLGVLSIMFIEINPLTLRYVAFFHY